MLLEPYKMRGYSPSPPGVATIMRKASAMVLYRGEDRSWGQLCPGPGAVSIRAPKACLPYPTTGGNV